MKKENLFLKIKAYLWFYISPILIFSSFILWIFYPQDRLFYFSVFLLGILLMFLPKI